MFKFSLQRHARLGSFARQHVSTLAARQICSRPLLAKSYNWPQTELYVRPLRQIGVRFYSQEYAVAESQSDDSPASLYDVTRFEDLAKLGVDERIIRAITVDMKYDTMTSVQSLTINPALKGVDL